VASILGFGYETAYDLWLRKSHRRPEIEEKRIFARGHKMEPVMTEMMEKDHGRIVKAEQIQYRDPDRPWLIFHADGMFPRHSPLDGDTKTRKGPGIWEAKAPGSHMISTFLMDGMTQNYICQVQMGMHVAGAALGFPVEWGTAGFLDYDNWETVAFDIDASWEFQKSALDKLEHFHECLVNDTPPDPMNTNDLPPLPEVIGGISTIEDDKVRSLALQLKELQPSFALAKLADKQIRDDLKDALKDYEAGIVPGVIKFSYKYSKPSVKYDGPGLVEYCKWLVDEYNDLVSDQHHLDKYPGEEKIVWDESHFIERKPATRTFRPTVLED
jgi:hypothetical protein